MYKTLFLILIYLLCSDNITAQKKVSILGDSYSTFSGHVIPSKNLCFYRIKSKFPNDVHDVKKTWWWMFINNHGYVLDTNNSYSGSTICNTGYAKNDYSDRSFIARMDNIGNPDIIFIFGGTNDCWAGSPLGEYKYSNWTNADKYKFRPAFAFLLSSLKDKHPKAKIFNICNSDLSDNYTSSIAQICKYYKVTNIELKNIDKQYKHPSVIGMQQIVEQINQVIK